MITFNVKHQNTFSRGELLLRSFFGIFYIFIPHFFCLLFLSLWASILSFISWWIILFTGRYPQSFFEYQVKLQRWNLRVMARMSNLCDGYPAFGLEATDEKIEYDVPYPETLSRGNLLLKTFFGIFYCLIPHIFILLFVMIASFILGFLAWWVVLFTGEYPKSWHEFRVGVMRWNARVGIFMGNMSDTYPPFSGKPS